MALPQLPRVLLSIAVLLAAIVGGLYLQIRPLLLAGGLGRVIESVGNRNCSMVPELQACEKVVLHQPTGKIYLACSALETRVSWTPALNRLDATGVSGQDYVATYDPSTHGITRLKLAGFNSTRGIHVHGMDVVPSSVDPSLLYVYLVNHRPPAYGDAKKLGADSVIEVFKTRLGSDVLTHVQTYADQIIITPNDVVGSSDGNSFYFTNDHGLKTGLRRLVSTLLLTPDSSVGFCHADQGCKYAITGLHSSNGITRGKSMNDTFYVADCGLGDVNVLERQWDNTLVLTEVIKTGTALDNLALDDDGAVWVAGLSDAIGLLTKFSDLSYKVASSAFRITINSGPSSFYGERYQVDKVFEDSGEIASGTTSVVYDSQRKRLFLHGIASPHLSVCRL
ncbi:hypothetical protein SERLA73DRAFT_179982 [Serpula lacrymans var. lacrymans S7.3]|uniref:SMP-30/Gluconolactonase/LRE-like region domain-containing protein n=1 Tax=Serpula lacrymans var. lacrymans (strain S7.3) TaxID=936435 RepID=F8PV86_SERL3|nr:hypothetical protein SERLA73DRAFT_179982 [Serpula lacrymans var. lacrymans S7.3]